MATFESFGTSGFTTTGTTITITKPTGLAVGDLMLAQINIIDTSTTVTTLSGWTILNTSITAGSSIRQNIYWKFADSSDVAASTFVWTVSGSSFKIGNILRISSASAAIAISQTSDTAATGGTSGTLTCSTQTPTRADSLLLFLVSTGAGVANDPTFGSYAIATSNPSWTEAYETSLGTTKGATVACGYANRTQITATGNATVAWSGATGSASDFIAQFIKVEDSLSQAHSPDSLEVSMYTPQILLPIDLVMASVQPTQTITSPTMWTNETKPTTTWINPDK